MPDQTEENADGRVTIKLYRPKSRTDWAEVATLGVAAVAVACGVLIGLAWFVVLPTIGLLWSCGWLR